MRVYWRLATLFLIVVVALAGQDREHPWTGRQVQVQLNMPGDDSGVDLPLDEGIWRERLLKYGVSLQRGQMVKITQVKRKGDHVEVHLNGGGFTNRELLSVPGVDSIRWGYSEEEERLRSDLRSTRDKDRRRRLESRYDSLRLRRVRPLRQAYEREQRAKHGSRFNVRTKSGQLEDLQQLLAPYLTFPQ